MATFLSNSGIELDTSFSGAAAGIDTPTVASIMAGKAAQEERLRKEKEAKNAQRVKTSSSMVSGVSDYAVKAGQSKEEKKVAEVARKETNAETLRETGTFETEEEARKREFMERATASAASYGDIFADSGDRKTVNTSTKGRTTGAAIAEAYQMSSALHKLNESRYVNPDGTNSIDKFDLANAKLQEASQQRTEVRDKHPIVFALFGDALFTGTNKKLNAAMRERQIIVDEIGIRNQTRDNAAQLIDNIETNRMLSVSETALSDTNKELQKANFDYVNGVIAKGIAEGSLNLNMPPEQVPAFTQRWLEFSKTGAFAAEFADHTSTITELFKQNGVIEEISRSEDPVGSIVEILYGKTKAVPGSEVHTQATMAMQSYTTAYMNANGLTGEKSLWNREQKEKFEALQNMKEEDRYQLIGNFAREIKYVGATQGLAGLSKLGKFAKLSSPENAMNEISNSPTSFDQKLDQGTIDVLQSTKWYDNQPNKYYTQVLDNMRSAINRLPASSRPQAIQTAARDLSTVFAVQRRQTVNQNKFTADLRNVPLRLNLKDSATFELPSADFNLDLDSMGALIGIMNLPMIGE